jgi:hypothetical protein
MRILSLASVIFLWIQAVPAIGQEILLTCTGGMKKPDVKDDLQLPPFTLVVDLKQGAVKFSGCNNCNLVIDRDNESEIGFKGMSPYGLATGSVNRISGALVMNDLNIKVLEGKILNLTFLVNAKCQRSNRLF